LPLVCREPSFAQSVKQQAATAPEEIIVTARKRAESVMKTPVVMQVIGQQQIRDLKISNLHDFSQAVPGLNAGVGFGPVGTVLFLRGIGSGDSASYVDQSVGFNIDGMGASQGTSYRSGSFDMARIELMKGPQGLFFGKSTTAGIVAITTADPTPDCKQKSAWATNSTPRNGTLPVMCQARSRISWGSASPVSTIHRKVGLKTPTQHRRP